MGRAGVVEVAVRALRPELNVQTFPARDFASRFFDAIKRGAASDALAFDNIDVLDGITRLFLLPVTPRTTGRVSAGQLWR